MIAVQIILIAIGALLADAQECKCECNGVCDEQIALRTEMDENKAEISKWNKHFDFVRSFAKDWQNQVAQVVTQQLNTGLDKTIEGVKKAFQASEADSSRQMEQQMNKFENLEKLLQTQKERADKLESTMENFSNQMSAVKTELQRTQGEPKPKCGVVDRKMSKNAGGKAIVWPWMAAVYKNGNQYGCDGSIIHPNFVLTSAWCMTYFGSDGLSVKLGLSDLQKGTYLQEREVKEVIKHSKFYGGTGEPDNHDYDIALLKLEKPIQLGPFVKTICLPPTEASENQPFYKPQSIATAVVLQDYIAAASSSQDAAPMLMNLTILPPEECRRKLKEESLEQIHTNPDGSFCAESSSTECPKEGSPVVQSRLERDGTRVWAQVGIRSWNVKCKLYFIPRLDHLRTWVQNIIDTSSTQ